MCEFTPRCGPAGRRWAATLLTVLLAVGLVGCGVGETDFPIDEGDAVSGGTLATDTEKKDPPSPDDAGSAEGLVDFFLMAASGGFAAANSHMKTFLTDKARALWRDTEGDNPPIKIIRAVGAPVTGAPESGRTPVTVTYQEVGILTDQGRIDDLADLAPIHTMVLWIVQDPGNLRHLRVDELSGAPTGLFMSDRALTTYYRIQPIYFWDQANTALVPDLRYVPLNTTGGQRATKVARWIEAGPSPWLTGAQRLPTGTISSSEPVVNDNGTFVVGLTAQAGAIDPDGMRRLMFQLQWSLRTSATSRVSLSIEGANQPVDANELDYVQANLSSAYGGAPQRFDITEERKVVQVPATSSPPAVLAAPENADVISAAISRSGAVAAFVRGTGVRRLQIVREGMANRIDTSVPATANLGRPAFVPGAGDVLLIATGGPGGRLWRVSTVDGSAVDVTPFNLSGVSSVSVSPDGRRIALIAGGQAYVTSLSVANNTVTVGSSPRPILAGQLTPATAVAWTNESWLYVTGTSGGAPAMWRVTADSVVAENLSGSLRGLAVFDLVAYPQGPSGGTLDVLATTPSGVYTYFRQLTPPEVEQPLRAPFFGT